MRSQEAKRCNKVWKKHNKRKTSKEDRLKFQQYQSEITTGLRQLVVVIEKKEEQQCCKAEEKEKINNFKV